MRAQQVVVDATEVVAGEVLAVVGEVEALAELHRAMPPAHMPRTRRAMLQRQPLQPGPELGLEQHQATGTGAG